MRSIVVLAIVFATCVGAAPFGCQSKRSCPISTRDVCVGSDSSRKWHYVCPHGRVRASLQDHQDNDQGCFAFRMFGGTLSYTNGTEIKRWHPTSSQYSSDVSFSAAWSGVSPDNSVLAKDTTSRFDFIATGDANITVTQTTTTANIGTLSGTAYGLASGYVGVVKQGGDALLNTASVTLRRGDVIFQPYVRMYTANTFYPHGLSLPSDRKVEIDFEIKSFGQNGITITDGPNGFKIINGVWYIYTKFADSITSSSGSWSDVTITKSVRREHSDDTGKDEEYTVLTLTYVGTVTYAISLESFFRIL